MKILVLSYINKIRYKMNISLKKYKTRYIFSKTFLNKKQQKKIKKNSLESKLIRNLLLNLKELYQKYIKNIEFGSRKNKLEDIKIERYLNKTIEYITSHLN